MFLKSLEILGFKSFADRTRITFSDGITALVGPNGCGKSNVVDAVKWVLGEQGARNMRAEKMEDVIFNGTELRKPLNFAEVSLTIANEQELLPLAMSEIAIKRRLYRSGESLYFINDTEVKLKDIRELFWDTGVGKAAYSVMEQGKIDQILSSKPEDRRYLFEEAAGITRFKVRRAEAERKLERTEENMRQVEGILAEVKRSYDSLKIQSDKAVQYRRLCDEIFEFERDIQLLRLRSFIQDRDRKSAELQGTADKRENVRREIEEIEAFLTENLERVNEMQAKIAAMQQEAFGLAVEQKAKAEQARQFSERQHETKTKISQLEVRQSALEEKIESLQEDVDSQEAELHERKRRLTEVGQNIASFERQINEAAGRITENEERVQDYEASIAALDEAVSALRLRLEEITEHIVTELDQKLKDAGYSAVSHREAQSAVETGIGKLKILLEGRMDLIGDLTRIEDAPDPKLGKTIAASLSEALVLVGELESAFKNYAAASPLFIDEFLSPEGIITKKRAIDADIAANRDQVCQIRDEITARKQENTALALKIDECRSTLEQLRIQKTQIQTQIEGGEAQIGILKRELASQRASLHDTENELFLEQKRYEEVQSQLIDLEGEIASIEQRGRELTRSLEETEQNLSLRNNDVSGRQELLKKKKEEMNRFQAGVERLTLDLATVETEIRNVKDNFRDAHSRDLMEFEERMFAIGESPALLRDKLAIARQQRKELGSVNLMAVEEFAEVKERYDFLSLQLADLQKGRDDLARITEEIRAESTELFLATYNKIRKNFHNMFRRLFGGGRAELRLSDPEHVLESGVDIFAQPVGKKLENIALLSGGEKTMTAVSLLFATYMVRPSPFCLLDEIDAALDEQNVLRFVHTLREFANVSQYIIITHNRKTVTGAGTVLGVTMEESGISKVVAIRFENEQGDLSPPDPIEGDIIEDEDIAEEEGLVIPPRPARRVHATPDETGTLHSGSDQA